MDNLEVDSIVFSVTYENYIKNIKQDKQNKTLGEWLIKDEMIDILKYSYVYLVGSNQMIVKKYHIEKKREKSANHHFRASHSILDTGQAPHRVYRIA